MRQISFDIGKSTRWLALSCLSTVCFTLSACGTSHKTGHENSPSLFEQMAKSVAGPDRPSGTGFQRASYRPDQHTSPKYQSFPGSDQIGRRRFTGQGARQVGNDFELNFNDVDLAKVAEAIMRDTLKLSYTFDPRLKGQVTLSTSGPVSREELLAIFESLLQMNRATMVKSGNHYSITALSAAQANTATSFDYASEARAIGPGYGVTFLPLRHVSSDTMLRMLGTFVARTGALRAEANRNLLIIRGTGSERASLVDVASSFDVDWLRGQSVGIYRLDNATPGEVIGELNQIMRTGQGGLGRGLVRFQPIDRLSAILAITSQSSVLRTVETWVRRLDRTDPAAMGMYVYQVENGRAKNLATLLSGMFGAGETGTSTTVATDTVAPSFKPSIMVSATPGASTSSSEAAGSGQSASATPRLAGASSSFDQGQSASGSDPFSTTTTPATPGPTGVLITADEVNNRLFIRANGRDYRKILEMLRRVDKPSKQVLINATLAEVTLNGNLRYGVQLFLKKQGLGVFGFSNGQSTNIQPNLPGMNLIFPSTIGPKVILDALSSKTDVRLVSSPSVVAVNNQTATLQVGDDVPVVIGRSQSVANPDAAIVNDIQYRKTGVILNVTPNISSDGLVTLDVEQEISNVVQTQAVGDSSSSITPTISQRRVASRIAVYSGQMVVLGGLMSERKESAKNRVPVVERVPFLGDVVGKTDTDSVRTELVIFIQPHVINDPADASHVANEVKKRLLALAPAYDRRERHDLHRPTEPSEASKWRPSVRFK